MREKLGRVQAKLVSARGKLALFVRLNKLTDEQVVLLGELDNDLIDASDTLLDFFDARVDNAEDPK